MTESNVTEEEQQTDPNVVQGQYSRLGFFLTASSFLVVAFITLVAVGENISESLTHAVAALGSFIAALHSFMNFWAWRNSGGGQIIHTWLTPFVFFAFWLAVWVIVTNCLFVLLTAVIFPLFWLFQRIR